MKRGTNYAIFLAILLTTFANPLFAQNYNLDSMIVNFREYVSYGTPPEDFTSPASDKYHRDAANIDVTETKKIQKSKDQFYLMSNFELDQIMSSGTVLYNDPITDYVNKIADNILKDKPELRKEVRFFVTKATSVNAFTYDNGVIMVNLGLIAQLENEAQLAFILSHEIIHYTKKHSIGRHLDREDLLKDKKDYKGLTFDKKILAYNRNNRKNEEEADTKGFEEIYINSEYSLSTLNGVFDVLQYSYLPFDLIKFDFSILEPKYAKIPSDYLLDKVSQIGTIIDEDDFEENEEWSSHPSIPKRREYITELVLANVAHQGKDFIQPKELFEKIRTLARFEVIRQHIIDADYPKALYNTYVELKAHPDNQFLERAVAGSLYGISKYKTGKRSRDVIYNYKKIEGESQQLYYMFKRLSKKQTCVMALHHCWLLKQKYPDNEYYNLITEDLFKDLIGKHKLKIKDFSQTPPLTEEEIAIKDSLEKIELDSLSKYEKIKKKKKKNNESEFVQYGFVDLFQTDSTFEVYFRNMQKDVREDNSYNDSDEEEISTPGGTDQLFNEYTSTRKYDGMQLGIHRLIIYQPTYSLMDNRKKAIISKGGSSKYMESEVRGQKFKNYIKENADMIGLEVEIVESKELDRSNPNAFPNMMSLRDVINEQLNSSVDLIKFTHEDAKRVSKAYGTKYVAIMGVLSARQPKDGALIACYTVLGVLPGIIYAVNPSNETLLYMIVYDIESGEPQLFFVDRYGTKDRKDLLNSKLYYLFYQIQREKLNYAG